MERSELLEEQGKWTDKVFTGDNYRTTAEMAGMARQRNEEYGGNNRKQNKSKVKSEKEEEKEEVKKGENDNNREKVGQEESRRGEGRIDIGKVQDIIKYLRGRYSTRANVSHIFKDWDKSNKGYLNTGDIQRMLDKMGLKINQNEANMMLIAIDANGDQKVSLTEFLDLVFNENDALHGIDFKKLKDQNEAIE